MACTVGASSRLDASCFTSYRCHPMSNVGCVVKTHRFPEYRTVGASSHSRKLDAPESRIREKGELTAHE